MPKRRIQEVMEMASPLEEQPMVARMYNYALSAASDKAHPSLIPIYQYLMAMFSNESVLPSLTLQGNYLLIIR
jgi:hypothetical protein